MSLGQETVLKKEIKALLVAGEPGNGSETREQLLTTAISQRCRIPIKWETVRITHSPENQPDFSTKEWADGFDIVIHNGGFKPINDAARVENLLKPHRQGTPALLLHGALFCCQGDAWIEFCGVTTGKIVTQPFFAVELTDPTYPINQPLNNWTNHGETLVLIQQVAPPTKVLAQSKFGQEGTFHPTAWAHKYGEMKTRVFASSLGPEDKTLQQSEYLDLLASGFLWALDQDIPTNLVLKKAPTTTLTTGRNLLTGKTALSSSTNPEWAIDGNTTTSWKPDRNETLNWWKVSFPEPQKLAALAIIWENKTTHPYWLEGSLDGKSWDQIVSHPSSIRGRSASYHELNAYYQHIRLTNPETGILGGISEFAAYENLRHVPFHLVSAAFEKNEPPPSPNQTPSFKNSGSNPSTVEEAFALIDDPNQPDLWSAGFIMLENTFTNEAVDQLITRAKATRSGKFRQTALATLARMYRNHEDQTWAKSTEIANYLESCFGDKRVDQEKLITAFLREDIAIQDVSNVLESLLEKPEFERFMLELVDRDPIPLNAIAPLIRISKNDAETPETRIRAGTILSRASAVPAMHQAFEIAAISRNFPIVGISPEMLIQTLTSNPGWLTQIDWLKEKTTSAMEGERDLAWQIITSLLEHPTTNPAQIDQITALIGETKKGAVPTYLFNEEPRPADLSISEIQSRLETVTKIDLENGKALSKQYCAGCHDEKGPSMEAIADYDILKAILTPDTHITEGFETHRFTLKDGNNYRGFIAEENETSIDVVDQTGTSMILQKEEVESREAVSYSSMPVNLIEAFSFQQVADLIGYLKSAAIFGESD